jgi:hypothetical protein
MGARMGSAQAAVLHSQLCRILAEVRHWQAAHPGAGDVLVNTLEHHLRMSVEAARLIDDRRRPDQESTMEYCPNCQSTYQRTPETEPKHLAPCTQCGSDGHAACQH